MLLRTFCQSYVKLKGGVLFSIICKHKGDLVKTVLCNSAKTCQIFTTFTESFHYSMGILLYNARNFTGLLKNYTLVSITVICSKH